MPNVFICYRRDDSRHQVGRLYDRLALKYGRDNVFKDVDSMPLGVDFRKVLAEKVGRCDVVLVLIGDDWLVPGEGEAQSRLASPTDYVRIEIESALERDIPVIPVLVGKAGMPKSRYLPESLQPLAYRHGIPVRPDPDFNGDMDRLIRGIGKAATTALRKRRRWILSTALVFVAVMAAVAVCWWMSGPKLKPDPTNPGAQPGSAQPRSLIGLEGQGRDIENPAVPGTWPKSGALTIEVSALAAECATNLKKMALDEVAVGKFHGRDVMPNSIGAQMHRLILAELTKRGIVVTKRARFELNGDYRLLDLDSGRPEAVIARVRIRASLIDARTGIAVSESLRQAHFDNLELLQAYPVTVDLPTEARISLRQVLVSRAILVPHASVVDSTIRSKPDGLYGVQILIVGNEGDPDPTQGVLPTLEDCLPTVRVGLVEQCRVRICNDADHDVAVRMSLDGIDQFAFAEPESQDMSGSKCEFVVVRRHSTSVIRGWFRSHQRFEPFLKRGGTIGTATEGLTGQICVQFAAAWETEEFLKKAEGEQGLLTGQGVIDTDLKTARRFVGAIRTSIGVRYVR